MHTNPHDTIEELFEIFGIVSQRELIALREYLAEEHVKALEAADVGQAVVIEILLDRTSRLLQRIEIERCSSNGMNRTEGFPEQSIIFKRECVPYKKR